MATKVPIDRRSSREWAKANPILELNVVALDTRSNFIKIGDGVTSWLELPFIGEASDDAGTQVTVVDAGSTVATPRPDGAVLVLWVVDGIEPDNLALNDVVLDPAVPTWSVYDGSALVALGGGGAASPIRLAALTFDAITVTTLAQMTGLFEDTSEGTGLAINVAGDGITIAESGIYWVGTNATLVAGSDATGILVAIQQGGSFLSSDGGPFNHTLLLQPDDQVWHQAMMHIPAGEIQFFVSAQGGTDPATSNGFGVEIVRIA